MKGTLPEPAATKAAEPVTEPASQPGTKEPESKEKTENRFNQLLKERAEEKARAERLEAELAELKRAKPAEPAPKVEPAKGPEAPKKPEKPKQEAFESWETWQAALEAHEDAKDKYYEDLADWKAQQAINKRETVRQVEAKNKSAQDAWNEKIERVKKTRPDFQDVAKDVPFNEAAAGFILNSDIGPEILIHLAENRQEAERIKGLDTHQTLREIARIELKLQSPSSPPGPKKVTSAPPPPPEVSGRSAAEPDEADRALAAGDVGGYQRAMNAREIAKLTRR